MVAALQLWQRQPVVRTISKDNFLYLPKHLVEKVILNFIVEYDLFIYDRFTVDLIVNIAGGIDITASFVNHQWLTLPLHSTQPPKILDLFRRKKGKNSHCKITFLECILTFCAAHTLYMHLCMYRIYFATEPNLLHWYFLGPNAWCLLCIWLHVHVQTEKMSESILTHICFLPTKHLGVKKDVIQVIKN